MFNTSIILKKVGSESVGYWRSIQPKLNEKQIAEVIMQELSLFGESGEFECIIRVGG